MGIRQLVITNIMGRSFSSDHVFHSDEAIYQQILSTIDKSSKPEEDDLEAQESNIVNVGSGGIACYGRLGVCLTRSVLMSLKDLPNEGVVLGGLLGAFLEILMTGSMTEAWQGLAKVEHVRHTRQCLMEHNSC